MNFKVLSFFDTLLGGISLLLLTVFSRGKRKFPEKINNITVVKFLGNGSLILAAPALYAIKKYYPQAKLILYTTPGLQPHAGMLKLFDEVILLEPARPFHSLSVLFKTKRRFSVEKTLIINLEFLSNAAVFICCFIRGSYTLCLSRKNHRFFDQCIIPAADKNVSMAETYDLIAQQLGTRSDQLGYATFLRDFDASPQKRLIIAPFCSNLSLRRMWDADNWSKLISSFLSTHPEYSVALIGAPSDRIEAQKILEASGNENKVYNFCGTIDFKAAFALICQSRCFCGIDSAPLHLARLAAVPSVSLWGATDPHLLTRNFPDYPEVVIFARQPCTPCVHTSKKCYLPGGCLNTIPPEIVIDAISELIDGNINERKTVYLNAKTR